MSEPQLKILPLGGLGEIGMNCLVVEYAGDMVLIDCGVQFPDQTYNGVDILIPDLSYVRERLSSLRAIVVTHGHDDHIGAIPYLARDKEIHVYATPFPTGLIKNKMAEIKGLHEIHFHEISPRQQFEVGCFRFDPIPVQHSIIEALAFAIETPVGTIIHSGDFKHDPIDDPRGQIGFEAFEEWGKRGVKLLMSDSTNAERCGHTLSEADIANSFRQIFEKQKSRLLIALFASNIRRVEKLMGLAGEMGKKVALIGRSMHSYTSLAHQLNAMNLPPGTLILAEETGKYPDDQVVVLATGSQAEPQSALVRITQGIHKDFKIQTGDQVILSSRFIPGNERAITKMIDDLYRAGAEVMYESIHQIHVSGHGFQDELLMLLNAVKPEFFVPIHGAYRHLKKHSRLALQAGVKEENIFVIEDGDALEVSQEGIKRGERYTLQKSALFEGDFLEVAPEILSQRQTLAKTGIVFAIIIRRTDNLDLISAPAVHPYGLLYRIPENPKDTLEEAQKHLLATYKKHRKDADLSEAIRIEMRRFFKKKVSHKPVVLPLIIDI